MDEIRHISVMSVPVADPERAKRFYSETLGFEVLEDSEFAEGRRWIQLAPHGAETSITLTTWFDDYPAGGMRGAVLEVGDLDAAKAALSRRGLAFEGEDMSTPWGRFAAFSDPDGNRWSLHQPPG
jgi:catechol 2,3-dioxygenase-like lactoylglutathione lyase family enzyme